MLCLCPYKYAMVQGETCKVCDSTSKPTVFLTLTGSYDSFFFDLRQSKSDQPALSLSLKAKQDYSAEFCVLLTEVPWLWFPFVSYYLNSKQEPMAMFVCFFSYGLT